MTVQFEWPSNSNFGSFSWPSAYHSLSLITRNFRFSQRIKYFRTAWSKGRSSLLIWFNKLSLLVYIWIKNDSDWQRKNACWGETILLNWYFIHIKIIEIHFLWFHRKLAKLFVFEILQEWYYRFGQRKNWFLTRLLIYAIFWENWSHILSLNLTFLFDLEQVWNISKGCTEWRKSNARARWRSERLYLSVYLM